MRRFMLPAALAGLIALSGCATGYHSANNPVLGIFGGFRDQDGYGTLTKVSFHGNSLITINKVTEYTLRRSAELAEKKNKPYFAIYRSIFDAYVEKPAVYANYFVVGGKPSGYAYVQFLDQEIPGAYQTADTLKKFESIPEEPAK